MSAISNNQTERVPNPNFNFIDFLKEFPSLIKKSEVSQDWSDYTLNKLQKYKDNPLLKAYVKNIMYQSDLPSRDGTDLIKALKRNIVYTGSQTEAGVTPPPGGRWYNPKRDFVRLYVDGTVPKDSDLKELTGNAARGYDYSEVTAVEYPDKVIKTYEGKFPLQSDVIVNDNTYKIAKLLGSQLKDQAYWYLQTTVGDNVASYRNQLNVHNNEPEIIQSDLWDFGSTYGKMWNTRQDGKRKTFSDFQGQALGIMGTPFILKSIQKIRTPHNENEGIDQAASVYIRQLADRHGVMKKDADGTYQPLYSLPQITVYPNTVEIDEFGRLRLEKNGGALNYLNYFK